MPHSKKLLMIGSVAGAFLLVYGSAISNRLLVGEYMIDRGLLDSNYIILALLCAIPFVLGSAISMNLKSENHFNLILVSGFLFVVLFVIVHWAFVYYGVEMSGGILTRAFIVFPISACLLVVAMRFGMNMEGTPEKEEYSL